MGTFSGLVGCNVFWKLGAKLAPDLNNNLFRRDMDNLDCQASLTPSGHFTAVLEAGTNVEKLKEFIQVRDHYTFQVLMCLRGRWFMRPPLLNKIPCGVYNNHSKHCFQLWASIAQWLEHWSCKPGVASSILAGGYFLKFALSREIWLVIRPWLINKVIINT